MKIAVPYKDGEVFQHFGHSEMFRIYTVEDGAVVSNATINTEGVGHEALAQLLKEQGVEVVIAGSIGDGALNALTAEGIDLCSGVSGLVSGLLDLPCGFIRDRLPDPVQLTAGIPACRSNSSALAM